MSANLQNKQEKNLMELLHKILKTSHRPKVASPQDQFLEKSLVVLEVKILQNLVMETKNSLELEVHMTHIQKH